MKVSKNRGGKLNRPCYDIKITDMESGLDIAVKNRQAVATIKRLYDTGAVTREEAKLLAEPVLDRINQATKAKTKELNQKYGLHRKPALLDFTNAMRNSY